MALRPCPECREEMSETARNCPHCGWHRSRAGAVAAWLVVLALLVGGLWIWNDIYELKEAQRNLHKVLRHQ